MEKVIFFNYNGIFHSRLRELIEEHDITKQKLSEEIGVSRQAISQYCDGSTIPNADKLLKIAEFFNVSTDYLLGSTNVQGTDAEVRAICEYTGLNEKSINKLHSQRETHKLFISANADSFVYERYEQLIDYLISPPTFCSYEVDLLTNIIFYKRDLRRLINKLKRYEDETKTAFDNCKLFGFEDTKDELLFQKFKMTNSFNAFLDQYTSKELAEYDEAEKQYRETHEKLLEEEESRRNLYANHNQTE